jgi:hypothetical protein
VQAVDMETQDLMSRLLKVVCLQIEEETSALLAEAADNGELL